MTAAELRALAAEAERDTLREALRRIVDAYDAEAEDRSDGEFALWKADDLVNAIAASRAALGEGETTCPTCQGEELFIEYHVRGSRRTEFVQAPCPSCRGTGKAAT